MASKILNISAMELEELINLKDKELVILDVRTISEFSSGYISGAVNMPVSDINMDKIEALINKNGSFSTKLIVYCQSGMRSMVFLHNLPSHALEVFEDLNVELYNLQGGIMACSKNILVK